MASAGGQLLYGGGASGITWTDRRDFYIEPNVVKELWTDVAPFLTAVSNWSTKNNLKDPLFKMFEHRNPWIDQRFTCADTDTLTTGDTEYAVTLPAQVNTAGSENTFGLGTARSAMYKGLVCSVHSADSSSGVSLPSADRKGLVVITTYTSGTEVSVKRLSASFTLVSGDWFVVVGNAHAENSVSPTAWADDLKVVWNQTQIMRTPIQISNILKKAVLRGEADELIRLRNQKGSEHKIQKNRTFLFGGSLLGTNLAYGDTFTDSLVTDTNSEPVRTTLGVYEALIRYGSTSGADQNIFNITEGSYTYDNFVTDMEKVFQYYPEDGVKTMFCGAGMLSYWAKLTMAQKSNWGIQLTDMKRDSLGFNFRLLETPHGILQLVHDPCITKHPAYNKTGIVVDKNNVFHAIFEPATFKQNILTDNGYIGQKDEYFSDEGIGMTTLPAHKYFKLT